VREEKTVPTKHEERNQPFQSVLAVSDPDELRVFAVTVVFFAPIAFVVVVISVPSSTSFSAIVVISSSFALQAHSFAFERRHWISILSKPVIAPNSHRRRERRRDHIERVFDRF
jgi:positive regulator of sigma E activity